MPSADSLRILAALLATWAGLVVITLFVVNAPHADAFWAELTRPSALVPFWLPAVLAAGFWWAARHLDDSSSARTPRPPHRA